MTLRTTLLRRELLSLIVTQSGRIFRVFPTTLAAINAEGKVS